VAAIDAMESKAHGSWSRKIFIGRSIPLVIAGSARPTHRRHRQRCGKFRTVVIAILVFVSWFRMGCGKFRTLVATAESCRPGPAANAADGAGFARRRRDDGPTRVVATAQMRLTDTTGRHRPTVRPKVDNSALVKRRDSRDVQRRPPEVPRRIRAAADLLTQQPSQMDYAALAEQLGFRDARALRKALSLPSESSYVVTGLSSEISW
jgi:hypothetical protein